ncbi:hypothetical protein, partial [Methylicorpusculum sp.]|uniref:hypothetical protein n=1 Tax=Methylicorpusculum sp. TaxID=2713644 RepID=UPI002AB95BDA
MFRLIGRIAYLTLAALISIPPAPMQAMNHDSEKGKQKEKVTSSTTINHKYDDEEVSDSDEESLPGPSIATPQKHRPRTNSLTDLHYQAEEELGGASSSHTYNHCSVFQNMSAAQRQQQQQSGLDQQNIRDRLSFVKQPRALSASLVKSLLDEAPENLKRIITTF